MIAAARSLLNQGFIEEVPVGLAEETWRSGDDGRIGLRVTEAGLRAIGVPALVSGLESFSLSIATEMNHWAEN